MNADWRQRPEGGGRIAIWMIRGVARHGGRAVSRALLLPITLYFLLVRGPERRASRDWLRRVGGRRAGLWSTARHIHAFASTILDRVFLLGGELERFRIEVEGAQALHRQLEAGRGVLMFGSHLGSFEVLRVLARTRPEIRLRVVLDVGHNPAMTQLLDALNPEVARTVIDAGRDGPGVALAIAEALEQGALVALLVDRAHEGQASVPAEFCGHPAPFPQAPWLIAAATGAPVVLGFGLYRGGNRYRLVFEPFSEGIRMRRQDRAVALPALVGDYAARLEHHARSAPYNWFNFYDFWQNDEACDHRSDAVGTGRHLAGRQGG
ncbi:acyltransferase [Lysobacter sp. GX 14042]|uniref:LpxL/LpxP family acyltransferase n=1 Tax=Lysobacter sp. GX 14042 TaxID=2907155 RepID=UPI0031BAF271